MLVDKRIQTQVDAGIKAIVAMQGGFAALAEDGALAARHELGPSRASFISIVHFDWKRRSMRA